MLFANSGGLVMAITMMFFFGLCLKMANGATYSIVPFVNPKAVGSVAGIVGAGGNVGAMLIGFLFKSMSYCICILVPWRYGCICEWEWWYWLVRLE